MRCIVLLVFCVLFLFHASGQSTVATFSIEGNEKTKTDFILSRLVTAIGDPLDSNLLDIDLERLTSITSISSARYEVEFLEDSLVHIHYHLSETGTFYPLVSLGSIKNNFWYQLGFKETNLGGRGMVVGAMYRNTDRRHNYTIDFSNPSISQSKFGFGVSHAKIATREPLYFDDATVMYLYDNTNNNAFLSYEISPRHQLALGASYFVEKYQKIETGEPLPGLDHFKQGKYLGQVQWDFIKLKTHFHYFNGVHNAFRIQTVYNSVFKNYFFLAINQLRYFKRLGSTSNFATRLRAGVATNSSSPFAPFVLDSYENIRGVGNRIERGTASLVLNLEFRESIVDQPIWAVQAVAFLDIGNWRLPGKDFSSFYRIANYRQFAGTGLRIIFKKHANAILRIDYGASIAKSGQSGFVLGVGQYF